MRTCPLKVAASIISSKPLSSLNGLGGADKSVVCEDAANSPKSPADRVCEWWNWEDNACGVVVQRMGV